MLYAWNDYVYKLKHLTVDTWHEQWYAEWKSYVFLSWLSTPTSPWELLLFIKHKTVT